MSSRSLWSLGFVAVLTAGGDSTARKLASLEELYRESLVTVRYTQQVQVSTAEPPQQEELTTTGIIVSADGVVMVSAVIFEPFNQVPHGVGIRFPASASRTEAEIRDARVRLNGNEYPATLLGRDADSDVAFFRISVEGKRFRPVVFDAGHSASVGQEVVVLSRLPEPLGPDLAVELTRVQSVVSKPQEGFLVTTGSADPVGSLVCDLEGFPLGMLDALLVPAPEADLRNPLSVLTVIRSLPRGVGRAFARPASYLAAAAARPPEAAVVRRGWLGVEMQALTPELASHMKIPVDRGIIIGYVHRHSPAEEAGLMTGDILVELEGRPIEVQRDEEMGAFAEKLLRSGAGARLGLGYLRGGERRDTVATLASAPKTIQEAATVEAEELDLVVREVTYDYLAGRFLEPDTKGVVIQKPPVAVRTNPNRVMRGDLLTKIDERGILDLESFRRVLDSLRQEKPEEVVLFIERGRESFFFAVKPDWK